MATLFAALSDHQIEEAIGSALARGNDLTPVLADRPDAKTNLKSLLQLGDETITELEARIAGETLMRAEPIRAIVNLLGGDPSKSARFADVLARVNPDNIEAAPLIAAMLTQKRRNAQNLSAEKGTRSQS